MSGECEHDDTDTGSAADAYGPRDGEAWQTPPMTPEQWDEASTREGLIAQLRGQRGAGRMIMAELRECREETARLRAKLAAWVAWEHAWVFGGEAKYPGSPGVTDPRETLDALERLAVGGWELAEREEAEDA